MPLLLLPRSWDDGSIDELLAKADESGDGELQLEEFVRWLFAEATWIVVDLPRLLFLNKTFFGGELRNLLGK